MNLQDLLKKIDNKGYKAYKHLEGVSYSVGGIRFIVHKVQSDPFAPPTKIRIIIPATVSGFCRDLFSNEPRKLAFCDFILRWFGKLIMRFSKPRGSGNSGLYFVSNTAYEIFLRSDCFVYESGDVELRIGLGLPAYGRKIASGVAEKMLMFELPNAAGRINNRNLDSKLINRFIETVEAYSFIKEGLKTKGLVSFIADGSILPRRSGVDDRPLEGAVIFKSPDSLKVSFNFNGKGISGMGIPEGVTLIVGGGFHGKTTLLSAIERGIYPHIPGDGRELVVTRDDAVKIRSEDGRSVYGIDISPFISNLPLGIDVKKFTTQKASGSTSVAAFLVESIEAGCGVILMDEDTVATNFLIRDARMQRLIPKSKEPITPFIDRVRELYEKLSISTIMVIGGSGDYFEVADTVIGMIDYIPHDLTKKAKAINNDIKNLRFREVRDPITRPNKRHFSAEDIRRFDKKIKAKGKGTIVLGKETIDISLVDQVLDYTQTNFIAACIRYIIDHVDENTPAVDLIRKFCSNIRFKGFDETIGYKTFNLSWCRHFEIMAAFNRLRKRVFV